MIKIAGMGWITPLGADIAEVCARISNGDKPEIRVISHPETGRAHQTYAIPPQLTEKLGRIPRLRRSSPISYYTVAAALAALADAGIELTPAVAARTAVVFAASDGSVVYTRRFYEQIVKQGAQAASPLLFPETVYNAPASHLSAQLGIDGASYTLVGDATAALSAIALAEQLIHGGEADYGIVVAAEELDWILCEAYRDWRFSKVPLTEGAGALVLAEEGKAELEVDAGEPFFRRSEAAAALETALQRLCGGQRDFEVLASCENGSFIDRAEAAALARIGISAPQIRWQTKDALGESLGASTLIQIIHAAHNLGAGKSALIPVAGLNHQAGGAIVRRQS